MKRKKKVRNVLPVISNTWEHNVSDFIGTIIVKKVNKQFSYITLYLVDQLITVKHAPENFLVVN